MIKALNIRLYPTKEQSVLMYKHIGCMRFVYNWSLSKQIDSYKVNGKKLSVADLGKELTILKNIEGIAYMVIAIKSRANIKYIISIICMNLCAFTWLIMNNSYRKIRLFAFLNPQSSYIHSKIYNITHSAGLFGNGFTVSKDMIPNMEYEMIFNYVIYTFGWLGATILVGIFAVFLLRILYITREIRHSYGKLLIHGLMSMVIVNIIWNILMNINLMTICGFNLPFISYAGVSCLLNMMYIGLILSVYRRRSLEVGSKITA